MSSFDQASGLILPGIPALSFTSGDYIAPALAGIFLESGSTATGFVYAIPFIVELPTTVDAIVYRNNDTAANGQKVRAGLYQFTAHGVATLLQSASERTLTASAVTNEDAITATVLVPGVRYAAGLTFDSSTAVATIDSDNTVTQSASRSFNAPSNKLFSADITPANWTASIFGCYRMTHVYAALPATFTATGQTYANTPFASLKVA